MATEFVDEIMGELLGFFFTLGARLERFVFTPELGAVSLDPFVEIFDGEFAQALGDFGEIEAH